MIWIGMFGGFMVLLAIAAAIVVGYREAEEEQLEAACVNESLNPQNN